MCAASATIPRRCPDASMLRAFNSGRLIPVEIDRVVEHLRECPTCLSMLDTMSADATAPGWFADPIHAPPISGFLRECELEDLKAKAKRLLTAKSAGFRIGPFEVLREIGDGGFSKVYLARDGRDDQLAAIKIPRPDRQWTARGIDAFLNEATTLASLSHPHIVRVLESGKWDEGQCYVAMDYIPGMSLKEAIRSRSFDPDVAAEIVASIARALHHAHTLGFMHRDVKPANIILDAADRPYVADFGMAVHDLDQWIHRGELAGTRPYMSPEQVRREVHRLDGRTDIWSLGVVMYEMLTGQRPFKGGEVTRIDDEILHRDPKPLRQINDSVPIELERICLKCLAKRMTERYNTALDLVADLRAYLTAARHRGGDAEAPVAAPGSPTLEDLALRIVPKGLRSFESYDAEFFPALLPGPRDLQGLPESIRFWKTRIENRDAEQTFTVGVIYGPSGCGKTSFVKAGLLPRISPSVLTLYVDAVGHNVEERIIRGITRRCPSLAPGLDVVTALEAVRRGEVAPRGMKTVIVLDQFEQWLHEGQEYTHSKLAHALRQCDGVRLQCLLLVRDDYWLDLSRFMQALEVPCLASHNIMLFDHFDHSHAEKVLLAFGRAYKRFNADADPLADEHRRFVDQAIAGLSDRGRWVPIRLAMFLEMVKEKAWTPATLKQLGGVTGLGVKFLEETFTAPTAPPRHRRHAVAIQAVLRALLPEPGTKIKGHLRSERQLREISDVPDPEEFSEMMQILDRETRLVTPSGVDESTADLPAVDKYYQLTHDYLVPSLQEWLTVKQRETKRGRAELLLDERTSLWTRKQENRNLPSGGEWCRIRWCTRPESWSPQQREMMRRAGRRTASRIATLAAGALVSIAGVGAAYAHMRSRTLVSALQHAPIEDVPGIVQEMAAYRFLVNPRLRQMYAKADASGDARRQLRATLALLPEDGGVLERLIDQLSVVTPQELAAIAVAARTHAASVNEDLWRLASDPDTQPAQRIRAAGLLAAYSPDDSRWEQISSDITDVLVAERPLLHKDWVGVLRPVAPHLLPRLAGRVAEADEPNEHRTLAELYVALAADEPTGFRPLEQIVSAADGPEPVIHIWLDSQRAAAAAALAIAGRWESVLPLLRQSPDPTPRTYLIDQLAAVPGAPHPVITRLEPLEEYEPSVRRALLMALGEVPPQRLPESDRERVASRLAAMRHWVDDPGTVATLEWVLGRWEINVETIPPDATGAPRMVTIPPGHVDVIVAPGELRRLAIEHGFELSSCEITIDQFLRFRQDHDWDERSAPNVNCPINEVTWYDAAAYCNWLSKQQGIPQDQWCYEPNERGEYAAGMQVRPDAVILSGYRLPTVREWEYACRCGSAMRWSIGDCEERLDRYAWSTSNSGLQSWPVGMLRPNDWGLFDMHGNVWEWCHDDGIPLGVVTGKMRNDNPPAVSDLTITDQSRRQLCGGTYLSTPQQMALDNPNWNLVNNRTGADGFRVARTNR